MFGYQTLKRLARGIRLQIKNSKIPRKNSSGNLKIYNIQKYFKTLAKLEYMKYVVCAESFEGVGALQKVLIRAPFSYMAFYKVPVPLKLSI